MPLASSPCAKSSPTSSALMRPNSPVAPSAGTAITKKIAAASMRKALRE